MNKGSKIYVAGHSGLVGSAILRRLQSDGYEKIVTRGNEELDLLNQAATDAFFAAEKPEYVFLAAAKVGGILGNSRYPAEFIYQNLMIGTNVIEAARKYGAKKLLNLGSSCIYPGNISRPMKESDLLSGPLEKTNEAYAVAKIAMIKLCHYYNQQYGTNFISVMPTNQYGPGDNFNMETAHLLPMIMRRFHLAKLLSAGDFAAIRKDLAKNPLGWGLDGTFDTNSDAEIENVLNKVGAYKDRAVLWGDGSVFREMMHSDDLADACVYLMSNKDADEVGELINITDGTDIQLRDLFDIVKKVVRFAGKLDYDTSKPNGTPKKQMDATHIKALGWSPKILLSDGVAKYYEWYKGVVEYA